jgi:p-aminobenzoyl-glutamate transporter AbgT
MLYLFFLRKKIRVKPVTCFIYNFTKVYIIQTPLNNFLPAALLFLFLTRTYVYRSVNGAHKKEEDKWSISKKGRPIKKC